MYWLRTHLDKESPQLAEIEKLVSGRATDPVAAEAERVKAAGGFQAFANVALPGS